MRESRTYGSGRGACDETHVPTATPPHVHHAARRRGGRVAAHGARAAGGDAGDCFLSIAAPEPFAHLVRAFTLSDSGYVDGRNVAIQYRWALGQPHLLPTLAADLVSRRVNVIFASGGSQSAPAAKAATTKIPIVFVIAADPVALGLVESLN